MVNKYLISVVIPVYNTAGYLRRCLDSLAKQIYNNIEVIIVNDGSSDNSEEIIKDYAAQYPNFYSIEQCNKGVGAARNTGMRKARGDYICFVDSDDYITADFCSYLMQIIGDADIAVAGRRKYVNGIYKRSKTAPEKLEIDPINAIKCVMMGKYNTRPAWGKLYKHEIIEKISFDEEHIFEEVRYSVDTFLAARKVVMADRELYNYCLREGSIITSDPNRRVKDLTLAFEYVYSKLYEKKLLSECQAEVIIWLSRVIIYNTRIMCLEETDAHIFNEYTGKLIKLYDEMGGLEEFYCNYLSK